VLRYRKIRLDWTVALSLLKQRLLIPGRRFWHISTEFYPRNIVAFSFSSSPQIKAYLALYQKEAFDGGEPFSLNAALVIFSGLECSLAHDKVFGLLGLTRSGL
jgi:hypothetical protein